MGYGDVSIQMQLESAFFGDGIDRPCYDVVTYLKVQAQYA